MFSSAASQPFSSVSPQSLGAVTTPTTAGLSSISSSIIPTSSTGSVVEWGWGHYLLVGVVQNPVNKLWHSWVSVDGGLTIQTLTANFVYERADQAARSYILAYEEGRLTGLSRDQLVSYVSALSSDVKLPQELPTDALREIGEFIRRLKIYPQQRAVYASANANSSSSSSPSPSAITATQTTSTSPTPTPTPGTGTETEVGYRKQPPLRRRAWQSR